MKKYFGFFIAMFMIFVLAGCKGTSKPKSPELLREYENKTFNEAVGSLGVVALTNHVDGDTIHVRNSENKPFKIRFLGIDTPESTGQVEPWGKQASDFTKEKLKDAEKIVLEGEGIDSTGSRILGWVWYVPKGENKLILLNWEIVLNGFSKAKLSKSAERYEKNLVAAEKYARINKLVLHSDARDPKFNYEQKSIQATIKYILSKGSEWVTGTNFLIEARVIRKKGTGVYIEDIKDSFSIIEDGKEKTYEGKGYIFAYGHFNNQLFYHSTKIGDRITFRAKLDFEGNFGTQFTDVRDVEVFKSDNKTPEYLGLEKSTDFINHTGRVVSIKCLVAEIEKKKSEKNEFYYVMTALDDYGNRFTIYIGGIFTEWRESNLPVLNKKYLITGAISEKDKKLQLDIGEGPRYEDKIVDGSVVEEVIEEDKILLDNFKKEE